jgi:hypothetical protein
MRVPILSTVILLAYAAVSVGYNPPAQGYRQWSLEKAVEILNDSPWARHETFTSVVRGVGSGISGEKEIYNTFYVRFLSARPIREAYARIQQIQYGYDQMDPEQRQRFDVLQRPALDLKVDDWIVVCLGFRSNDPNEESSVRRFFLSQTAETLKTKAFLSTSSFPQVEIHEFFPPIEESVGAKFIFPRMIDGRPVVSEKGESLVFELLEVPGAEPRLRAAFFVEEMMQEGNLIL